MADTARTTISLEDYFRSTPTGSINTSIGDNLYGLNQSQITNAVASNKDTYGYTFFTRPQLNLQSNNIRNVRQMYELLTQESLSIPRYVRCALDPRLPIGFKNSFDGQPLTCPLLDNELAFFASLTNNLNSISGWPDIVIPAFTSKAGLYNEVTSFVDGTFKHYESFDIDASFRNTRGDPILYLFYIWIMYSTLVYEGYLNPYPDMITENEIDYNTRIYRLVMDPTKTYVRKIAATGASFPLSVPTGNFFDFNNDKPYNDQNKDFTIRFRCLGALYFDGILVQEFNRTVGIFSPDMKPNKMHTSMVKVDKKFLNIFRNRGYPYIEPSTYELQWWVPKSVYNSKISSMGKLGLLPSNANSTFVGD